MGRTAAAENYIRTGNSGMSRGMYSAPEVYGNVVRKPQPQQYKRLRSSAQILRSSKALKKQKALFVFLGTAASIVMIGLSAVLLHSIAVNNNLGEVVAAKETEYENLVLNNDAREYEINSSVDLNYVINAATNELGMVRSNASQIVTYSIRNSEYLQQVAQVPVK